MSLPPRNAPCHGAPSRGAGIRCRSLSRTGAGVALFLGAAACSSDSTGPDKNADCPSGQAAIPAIGTVISPLPGTTVCAGGGANGAEYVLIPFNSSTQSAKVSFDVTATGVSAAGSASFSILPGVGEPTVGGLDARAAIGRNAEFEAKLRAKEAALDALIPAARQRASRRSGGLAPSLAVIPSMVTVDQRLELNTNADNACTNPVFATGRVVAVTAKSIIVADTANPVGGFTDDDYRSIAQTFDNVVDPVITAAFGEPADIDGNDRILLFFTRRVNELTPSGSESGQYVAGFFFGRDLFPPTSGGVGSACASSNFGEMFYLLVPDPTGIVNGHEYSRDEVRDIAVSIVAHEYQHLINASRRMYVSTTAEDFEDVWLNEGLSHIAEELVFYAEAGKQPRRDLDANAIRTSQASIDAFNNHAGANFARFRKYLEKPDAHSPYSPNDSLATRGASWSFLRYAVDRQAGAENTYWFKLANSGKIGFANLRDVFGADVTGLLRGWSTSVFTDNLAGIDAQFQQPSWKFRSLFKDLSQSGTYPLATISLTDGVARSLSIVGGGSAYARFAVPAGGAGQVTWGTVPATMQMTLVRTR